MKNILLLAFAMLTAINAHSSIYTCLDSDKGGIGFDNITKQAWQISPSTRQTIEIYISPEDFRTYRCPGCYSFDGIMKVDGQNVLSTARTYYNFEENQMLMQYNQKGSPEQSFEMLLKCSVQENALQRQRQINTESKAGSRFLLTDQKQF